VFAIIAFCPLAKQRRFRRFPLCITAEITAAPIVLTG